MLAWLNSLNRRGAMFGLDARVALLIFAGLAIITGAMIYKVATQTRYTAVAAELSNVSKAFGEYVLDVGAAPVKIEELISSTAPGWNGPYLPYADTAGNNTVVIKIGGKAVTFRLFYYPDVPADAEDMDVLCTADNCWGWLSIGGYDQSFIKPLDRLIDGVDDPSEGNLRYEAAVVNGTQTFYKLGSVRAAP
jgi:hypothetical protein